MDPQRKELVARLYAKRAHLYRDPTRYTNVAQLSRRIDALGAQIRAVPAGERVPANAPYRRAWLERRLLSWKRRLYEARGAPGTPMAVVLWAWQLQLNDGRHGRAERQACKEAQLKLLLYISLATVELDELRRMAAAD